MTSHSGGQAQPLWRTLDPDVVMGMTPFTRGAARRHPGERCRARRPGRGPTNSPGRPAAFARRAAVCRSSTCSRSWANAPRLRGTSDPRGCPTSCTGAPGADAATCWTASAMSFGRRTTGATRRPRPLWSLADREARRWSRRLQRRHRGNGRRSRPASRHHRIPDMAVSRSRRHPTGQALRSVLSSVHVDTAGLGRYLAELALSATGSPAPLAGPETDAHLVMRETT